MVNVAPEEIDHRRGLDHIGIGTVSVVHDGAGRVLLMKRGQKARDEQGTWDVCGGAIEFGESIEDAARREVMEELCVQALDIVFLTVYEAHRKHNGKQTHWIQIVNAVLVDPEKVKIGEPHKIDELKWFTTKNLPSPMHSQIMKPLTPAVKAGFLK